MKPTLSFVFCLLSFAAARAATPSCDVCVVGGGVAGVSAALQAARAGAKTVLVEQGFQVGGNLSCGGVSFPGLFHAWGRQVIAGCGWDLVTNCVALAGGTLPDFAADVGRSHWRHQVRINVPLWVALAEERLIAAGVDVRYHTAPSAVAHEEGGAGGWTVQLSAMGEERTLRAAVLIDATGNGALAALAGVKRLRGDTTQPGGYTYLIDPGARSSKLDIPALERARNEAIARGELNPNDICRGVKFLIDESNAMIDDFRAGTDHGTTIANYVVGADNSTAEQRTVTDLRGRASLLRTYRFLKRQPGLGKARVVWAAPEVGVRETWRVEGDYVLTADDYVSGRVFEDSLCYSFYPIDIHKADESRDPNAERGVRPKHLVRGVYPTVPLRSLLAKGTRNLLVVGRCISTDRKVNSAVRVQATCMATGQVAGEAAAFAAKRGCDVRELPLAELRARLAASGAIVPAAAVGEAKYLEWKWRRNLADPATGLDYPTVSRQLPPLVEDWSRSNTWAEVKAKMFGWLCDNVAVDVSGHDWFPTFALWSRDFDHIGKKTDGLHPVLDIMRKRDAQVWKTKLPGVKSGEHGAWSVHHDFDHAAPDWDDVLKTGFPGLRDRVMRHWRDDEFHRTRLAAADAVLRLLDRLIAQGERKAKLKSGVEGRRARLEKQIASLKRLRNGAPVTAHDAMNFIYLYWVMSEEFESIQVRTLGNLDRLLTPYYRDDLSAGRTTEAELREQFRHFWWQWGSMDYYWGQPTYFGGTKADGTTEYTDVSRMMFEEVDAMALPTPKMHVKIGRSTPDWVWRQTIDMARRQRPISFIGEEPHWRVIRSLGYSEEQARTFLLWGCYEWAIRDGANDTFAGVLNLMKPLTDLLAEAKDNRFKAETFEDFVAAYRARLTRLANTVRETAFEMEKCLGDVNPSLLFSLASERSVKSGVDAFSGGLASGNNSGIWAIGLGSTADALAAVKEMVYEGEKVSGSRFQVSGGGETVERLSLKELGEVLAKNWAGREELRQKMLRRRAKWGNNDPLASGLAREVVGYVSRAVNGKPNSRGGVFKVSGHSGRCHYWLGHQTGATPDGRKAGEEFSKNISPTMGADTQGATALINSAAALDARDLPGDFPLDVALLPNTAAGEKGLQTMRTLIEQYFANGGLVIQFNVHDAETLRDAQRHPEKYENLQVRVCGWNVRWNDIPKVEQDKFILRAESLAR